MAEERGCGGSLKCLNKILTLRRCNQPRLLERRKSNREEFPGETMKKNLLNTGPRKIKFNLVSCLLSLPPLFLLSHGTAAYENIKRALGLLSVYSRLLAKFPDDIRDEK